MSEQPKPPTTLKIDEKAVDKVSATMLRVLVYTTAVDLVNNVPPGTIASNLEKRFTDWGVLERE